MHTQKRLRKRRRWAGSRWSSMRMRSIFSVIRDGDVLVQVSLHMAASNLTCNRNDNDKQEPRKDGVLNLVRHTCRFALRQQLQRI